MKFMRNCVVAVLLTVVGSRVCVAPASAQTVYYDHNAILDSAIATGYIGHDNVGNNSSPTVTLAPGGAVTDTLYVFNNSVLNITGGSIGSINAVDHSSVNVYNVANTTNGLIIANGNSTVNVYGGTNLKVSAGAPSQTNIYGGTFAFVGAGPSAVINLYGTGLKFTPTLSIPNATIGYLSGTLTDGSSVNGVAAGWQQGGGFRFLSVSTAAVPEPASVALLATGSLSAAWFLRPRKHRSSGV